MRSGVRLPPGAPLQTDRSISPTKNRKNTAFLQVFSRFVFAETFLIGTFPLILPNRLKGHFGQSDFYWFFDVVLRYWMPNKAL